MAAGGKARKISIHAPREGGDGAGGCIAVFTSEFQSTPPARGETRTAAKSRPLLLLFQSTPPVRGATQQYLDRDVLLRISIHAPREGGDVYGFQ